MTQPLTSPNISYILRLWQAGDNDSQQWRAALIDPQTDERRGFSDLEALTAHLQARMKEYTNAADNEDRERIITTPFPSDFLHCLR